MIMNQKRTVPAAIPKSLQTRAWLPVDMLVSDVWAITFVQFSTQTLPPLSGGLWEPYGGQLPAVGVYIFSPFLVCLHLWTKNSSNLSYFASRPQSMR